MAKTLDVTRAFDESVIETLPMLSRDEAFASLERAHAVYEDRSKWLKKHERMAILDRAAQLVDERCDALATQAAAEGGKPLKDSIVEVKRAVSGIKEAIAQLHVEGGREIPMGMTPSSDGHIAYTFREPRGVCMSISAFNHPFNLIIHQVIPAVAVGAPVVVKPAKKTPLSCKALLEILWEAGLPKDWAQLLLCDTAVAEEMVSDPRVAFFSFIGSARVGWHLRSKLARGAGAALEHGGVAPVIVDESADLDKALPALLRGSFYHAGQVCVSVQRIYAHSSKIDELTARLVAGAKGLVVGDPTNADTDVGPLISPKEVDRVEAWVKEAKEKGGEILCGGERLSTTTFAPTVIKNPPDDVQVSCAEVFGPVVCVYSYDDLDQAIARANAPDTYFQAAVFTEKLETALYCRTRLNGLAIMVNTHSAFRVDWMPFGGTRASGLGMGGILSSMEEMTMERMMVIKSSQI